MHVEIRDDWNGFLETFPDEKRDIYFSESYVKLACGKDEAPLCIICQESEKTMILPFLRGLYQHHLDFETPYGYGGPISNCDDGEWNKKALQEIISYFRNEGYLAGFIRFHPLLNNADLCRGIFPVVDDRKTVVVDTSVSEKMIWEKQISSKNRNMIRKAERNGLEFFRDDDFLYMEDFKKLYDATMRRVSADDFYFFEGKYYDEFVKSFRGKGFLGCIKKGSELVGAALFMRDGCYGHYHLAGSNRDYSSLGTNNLLLWRAACEMHRDGVKAFHLGGGNSPDEENSLFKFKKSFSPNTRQFSIGKIVFDKEAYDKLCSKWEVENPEKVEKYKRHLLKYRY